MSVVGMFRSKCSINDDGYIDYHASTRYSSATLAELNHWLIKGNSLIRNAAAIELSNRYFNNPNEQNS
jgi:hypothetical protein